MKPDPLLVIACWLFWMLALCGCQTLRLKGIAPIGDAGMVKHELDLDAGVEATWTF
jgi:hypothetical protein